MTKRTKLAGKKNWMRKSLIKSYSEPVGNCKLWDHNTQAADTVENEQVQVVVGIMCAYEKQTNGHQHQELLRRGVLVAIVNLLPHRQVVVGSVVKLKGRTLDLVKHDVGAHVVGQVG